MSKQHEIKVSFSSGVQINNKPTRGMSGDILASSGIQKEDRILVTPGDKPVDIAFANEIFDCIRAWGYPNVIKSYESTIVDI